MLRIGKVEVSVGRKPKVRRLVEGVGGDLRVSREEGKGINGKIMERKGIGDVKVKDRFEGKESAADAKAMKSPSKNTFHFLLVYNSKVEDRKWATSVMIATVHDGDSTLALQQCVEDAGFYNVVVTPLGGYRVFLNCTDNEDIWQLFNGALNFFGMLFSNIHKWSVTKVKYERGAWLRVYGVPIHALSDAFFKLCVTEIDRFIRADECTVDKARLDLARILVSTPHIEIVNTSSEIIIDGSNLGEEAFLTKVEHDSTLTDLAP